MNAIDLGLPSGVKWCDCNLGANKPEEFGNYYAWGELNSKEEFLENNSKTWGKEIPDFSGDRNFDAVINLVNGWKMPSKQNFEELIDNCSWLWVNCGYKIQGRNGNSIFLPAAGYSKYYKVGQIGYYWTSTPADTTLFAAWGVKFSSDYTRMMRVERFDGQIIRPIQDK